MLDISQMSVFTEFVIDDALVSQQKFSMPIVFEFGKACILLNYKVQKFVKTQKIETLFLPATMLGDYARETKT